jgi:hypothetical protein
VYAADRAFLPAPVRKPASFVLAGVGVIGVSTVAVSLGIATCRRGACRAAPWRARSVLLCDLDEIAAGVVENGRGHRPHRYGRLREMHAQGGEAVEFGLRVVDAETTKPN